MDVPDYVANAEGGRDGTRTSSNRARWHPTPASVLAATLTWMGRTLCRRRGVRLAPHDSSVPAFAQILATPAALGPPARAPRGTALDLLLVDAPQARAHDHRERRDRLGHLLDELVVRGRPAEALRQRPLEQREDIRAA